MVQVWYRPEFEKWFASLSQSERKSVGTAVKILEIEGVTLKQPWAKPIKGAPFNLWELRPARGQSPLRVFYSFDEKREAVLLIGGDKSGMSEHLFYRRIVEVATPIWGAHCKELEAKKARESQVGFRSKGSGDSKGRRKRRGR